jgi:hypothetical protein
MTLGCNIQKRSILFSYFFQIGVIFERGYQTTFDHNFMSHTIWYIFSNKSRMHIFCPLLFENNYSNFYVIYFCMYFKPANRYKIIPWNPIVYVQCNSSEYQNIFLWAILNLKRRSIWWARLQKKTFYCTNI